MYVAKPIIFHEEYAVYTLGCDVNVDLPFFTQSWSFLGTSPQTEDWSHISAFNDAAVGMTRSGINKLLLEVISVMKDGTKALEAKGTAHPSSKTNMSV